MSTAEQSVLAAPYRPADTMPLPASRGFYRPELDVLRFCAFLLVFITHAGGEVKVGALGVPVFFVLSAYLITELLLRELSNTGRIVVRKFYVRRMLRIWPLYFAALFAGFILAQVTHQHTFTVKALLAFIFLSGNWFTVFYGYLPLGFGVLWSIGVEEQFYLAWPSILRWGKHRGAWIAAIAMYVVSQVTVAYLTIHHVFNNPGVWANTLVQIQYFAIGIFLCLVLNHRVPRINYLVRILLFGAGIGSFLLADCFFVTTAHMPSSLGVNFPGYFITGIGATLLFFSLAGMAVPKWMKPFVYLGKISYGLYIYHRGVIEVLHVALRHHVNSLVQAALSLTITIVVASLSYRYFETPFLRLKHRFETVDSRPV